MSHRLQSIALPPRSLGTARSLAVYRFGREGARPKAYLQAALHADELPGTLVLRQLCRLLDQGEVTGEVVVVPVANPVGASQHLLGSHIGRFDLDTAVNFNRGYWDIGRDLEVDDPGDVAAVRRALLAAVAGLEPAHEAAAMKRALMGLAIDADVVLDLHCDSESLMHVFVNAAAWPAAEDLTRQLGTPVVLLEEEAGGLPFDEAAALPWLRLAERFPGRAAPCPVLAATVELRGEADVSMALAEADARALFAFLQRRGIVAGDPGPLPAARCAATPLTGVEYLHSPVPGVVNYLVEAGTPVARGQEVAEVYDPTAPWAAPLVLRAGTDGLLFARRAWRHARPGETVAKIAGSTPLPGAKMLEA
ncbi:MAG: M14 family metallopeptidase [Thalassobaculales bacterium]